MIPIKDIWSSAHKNEKIKRTLKKLPPPKKNE